MQSATWCSTRGVAHASQLLAFNTTMYIRSMSTEMRVRYRQTQQIRRTFGNQNTLLVPTSMVDKSWKSSTSKKLVNHKRAATCGLVSKLLAACFSFYSYSIVLFPTQGGGGNVVGHQHSLPPTRAGSNDEMTGVGYLCVVLK